jgi:DNA-binding beta-propeller fold protein YncE
MVGAKVTELVPPGLLSKPSGLALHGDVLYVTDNATSSIYAFDTSGKLLLQLDTELPAGTLAGIAVGPDDKLYFTDQHTGGVSRIDPN